MKGHGFKTGLIYSSKMSAISDLNKDNIIFTSIGELSKEERHDYLVNKEHFKAQFLRGFNKDEKGQVMSVQDSMIPSFTLKNKQVEVVSDVSTSSSNLISQL
jgi:hypothetical protein